MNCGPRMRGHVALYAGFAFDRTYLGYNLRIKGRDRAGFNNRETSRSPDIMLNSAKETRGYVQ
jgi:hypothetical protein